jgi:hypothetical protein
MFFNFYYIIHLKLKKLESEYSTGRRSCTEYEHRAVIDAIHWNLQRWVSDPEGSLGDTSMGEEILQSPSGLSNILYKK